MGASCSHSVDALTHLATTEQIKDAVKSIEAWQKAQEQNRATGGANRTGSTSGSVLQRIGGADMVKQVVEGFYRRLYADERLLVYLHDHNVENIRTKQSAFMSWLFGFHTQPYNGKHLRAAHLRIIKERGFSPEDFGLGLDYFADSMRELSFPEVVVNEVMAKIRPFKDVIFTPSSRDAEEEARWTMEDRNKAQQQAQQMKAGNAAQAAQKNSPPKPSASPPQPDGSNDRPASGGGSSRVPQCPFTGGRLSRPTSAAGAQVPTTTAAASAKEATATTAAPSSRPATASSSSGRSQAAVPAVAAAVASAAPSRPTSAGNRAGSGRTNAPQLVGDNAAAAAAAVTVAVASRPSSAAAAASVSLAADGGVARDELDAAGADLLPMAPAQQRDGDATRPPLADDGAVASVVALAGETAAPGSEVPVVRPSSRTADPSLVPATVPGMPPFVSGFDDAVGMGAEVAPMAGGGNPGAQGETSVMLGPGGADTDQGAAAATGDIAASDAGAGEAAAAGAGNDGGGITTTGLGPTADEVGSEAGAAAASPDSLAASPDASSAAVAVVVASVTEGYKQPSEPQSQQARAAQQQEPQGETEEDIVDTFLTEMVAAEVASQAEEAQALEDTLAELGAGAGGYAVVKLAGQQQHPQGQGPPKVSSGRTSVSPPPCVDNRDMCK